MTCPRCSFENPEGMYFCGKCGCELSVLPEQPTTAPTPEEKLKRIQRYLPEGLAKRILSQKDRIEGERRQVTIMFCDMKGFTPLTERLGPEETFTLMDKVIEILIHKVNEFEGMVNEIRGDGILAVFGALDALEEAPQRAIRSAIEIHKQVAEFSRSLPGNSRIGPILLRIGINTGPVVIGTVGNDLRVHFTVVGDTINMASRMETLAEPGTTYVTDDTYRLTKDLFHFQPLGKKPIKGKQQPIPVYKVLSSKEAVYRRHLGSERMIYSTIVDRESELNLLELQVMKVINGHGSVVNIIGEAGVGKSRLLAELKNREVIKKLALLEGWAMSIGRNLSFHPITNILKQWAGIKVADVESVAFDKLQTSLRTLLPEDHAEVLPFVATLMRVKLPQSLAERLKGIEGEALEKLILRSMRNLLIKASEVSPLIIVMEDLHWADKSTIELLESLLRLAETQRIMFINVFRPGYKETGDRILQGLKDRHQVYSVQMQVDPLNEKDTASLINNIAHLGDVHGPLITKIVERTGGNPFFIEEVMRSFVDEHALVMQNGAFYPTEKVNSLPIPSTIRDVLTARMDRLDEQGRDLLKVASVIGRTFLRRILLEIAPSVVEVDAKLSRFQEIQFIRERSRLGETEYLFNHALVQETTYESILPPKRKELHLRVAQAIESLFKERLHEFYGMLAYHYSRGECLEKAEEYLIKAGEEALRSSASNEALYYYQEALRIYLRLRGDSADPEKVAMLEKNIGLALFSRGHYAEAVEHCDKALSYYWGGFPKNAVSTKLKFLSSFITFLLAIYFPSRWFKKTPTQNDAEAIDLFQKEAEVLAIINPKRFRYDVFFFSDTIVQFDLTKVKFGIANFVGASAPFSFGGLSHRIARRVLDYAKTKLAPDDAKQWIVYDVFDTVQYFLEGRWNQISECNEELVGKNLRNGETYYSMLHYYWHGLPLIYQGHFDKAEMIVTRLNEIAETYENDIVRLLKHLLNINLLIERRQLRQATDEAMHGIDLIQKKNYPLNGMHILSLKAFTHLLMGDMEEAEKSLDKADRIRPGVMAVPFQLSCLDRSNFEYFLCRMENSLRAGHRKDFAKNRKKAFSSGKRLLKNCKKASVYRTESYRLWGVYHWLTQNRKSAFEWWHKALSEGERLGARPQVARTYAEIARRLFEVKDETKQPSPIQMEEFLEKARVMFVDLGLHQDLEKLDLTKGGTEGGPSEL